MINEFFHSTQFVVLFIVLFTKWNQYLYLNERIQQLVNVQTTTKKRENTFKQIFIDVFNNFSLSKFFLIKFIIS